MSIIIVAEGKNLLEKRNSIAILWSHDIAWLIQQLFNIRIIITTVALVNSLNMFEYGLSWRQLNMIIYIVRVFADHIFSLNLIKTRIQDAAHSYLVLCVLKIYPWDSILTVGEKQNFKFYSYIALVLSVTSIQCGFGNMYLGALIVFVYSWVLEVSSL